MAGADAAVTVDSLGGEPSPAPPATCVTVLTTDQPRFVFAMGVANGGREGSAPKG